MLAEHQIQQSHITLLCLPVWPAAEPPAYVYHDVFAVVGLAQYFLTRPGLVVLLLSIVSIIRSVKGCMPPQGPKLSTSHWWLQLTCVSWPIEMPGFASFHAPLSDRNLPPLFASDLVRTLPADNRNTACVAHSHFCTACPGMCQRQRSWL